MRSEDALRRALTQAIRAEHAATTSGEHSAERDQAVAFAHGARAALQWALEFSDVDPWGGVGIHEAGERSLYRPAERA